MNKLLSSWFIVTSVVSVCVTSSCDVRNTTSCDDVTACQDLQCQPMRDECVKMYTLHLALRVNPDSVSARHSTPSDTTHQHDTAKEMTGLRVAHVLQCLAKRHMPLQFVQYLSATTQKIKEDEYEAIRMTEFLLAAANLLGTTLPFYDSPVSPGFTCAVRQFVLRVGNPLLWLVSGGDTDLFEDVAGETSSTENVYTEDVMEYFSQEDLTTYKSDFAGLGPGGRMFGGEAEAGSFQEVPFCGFVKDGQMSFNIECYHGYHREMTTGNADTWKERVARVKHDECVQEFLPHIFYRSAARPVILNPVTAVLLTVVSLAYW